MFLYLRMALYLIFGVLAGQGLVVFDAEVGTVTFRIEDALTAGTAIVGFVGTFITSRIAAAKGGKT